MQKTKKGDYASICHTGDRHGIVARASEPKIFAERKPGLTTRCNPSPRRAIRPFNALASNFSMQSAFPVTRSNRPITIIHESTGLAAFISRLESVTCRNDHTRLSRSPFRYHVPSNRRRSSLLSRRHSSRLSYLRSSCARVIRGRVKIAANKAIINQAIFFVFIVVALSNRGYVKAKRGGIGVRCSDRLHLTIRRGALRKGSGCQDDDNVSDCEERTAG